DVCSSDLAGTLFHFFQILLLPPFPPKASVTSISSNFSARSASPPTRTTATTNATCRLVRGRAPVRLYLTPAPTPSRAAGLLRLLLGRPDGRDSRRRLGDLFHPPPLRPAKSPTQYIDETLAALAELGLVAQDVHADGVTVHAGPELPPSPHGADALPRVFASVALRPEVNGQPNRFARACGWFLAQP